LRRSHGLHFAAATSQCSTRRLAPLLGKKTVTNITMPGVALKEETYRGFQISWQEPPVNKWTANVASESMSLMRLMKQNGSKVIEGRDRDGMIASAKKYIDGLLG
jgi:hypothetical protein